eukprot:782496-Lingulodinium_polyedra.AAC.1
MAAADDGLVLASLGPAQGLVVAVQGRRPSPGAGCDALAAAERWRSDVCGAVSWGPLVRVAEACVEREELEGH